MDLVVVTQCSFCSARQGALLRGCVPLQGTTQGSMMVHGAPNLLSLLDKTWLFGYPRDSMHDIFTYMCGLRGQCRYIWQTWSVWVYSCYSDSQMDIHLLRGDLRTSIYFRVYIYIYSIYNIYVTYWSSRPSTRRQPCRATGFQRPPRSMRELCLFVGRQERPRHRKTW